MTRSRFMARMNVTWSDSLRKHAIAGHSHPAAGRGRRCVTFVRSRRICVRSRERDTHATCESRDLTRAAAAGSRSSQYDRVVVCGGDGTLNLSVRDFDLERGPSHSSRSARRDLRASPASRAIRALRASSPSAAVRARWTRGCERPSLPSRLVSGSTRGGAVANDKVKLLRGSAVYSTRSCVSPALPPRERSAATAKRRDQFAVFGNSRQYGAGIRITPDAKIDDRQLDVCIVHRSRASTVLTLPLAYTGKHVRKPFVELRRGRTIALRREARWTFSPTASR